MLPPLITVSFAAPPEQTEALPPELTSVLCITPPLTATNPPEFTVVLSAVPNGRIVMDAPSSSTTPLETTPLETMIPLSVCSMSSGMARVFPRFGPPEPWSGRKFY